MKKRFYKSLEESTELRAFFVLLVVLALHVRRIIPTLRPQHLLVPTSLLQMLVFIVAALNPHNFIPVASIGFFLVVGLALIPSTIQRPRPTAHWVKNAER